MSKKTRGLMVAAAVCFMAGLILLIVPHRQGASEAARISPSPGDSFCWDYLLYVPEQITSTYMLVIPNNTGDVSDDIEMHLQAAVNLMEWHKNDAEMLGTVLLIPVFPRPLEIGHVYTHALDRDCLIIDQAEMKRLDLQLIAMIDDARQRLFKQDIDLSEQVLLYGFSASGMFANRFSLLHPARVKAAAIGSPGGWPIVPAEQYEGKELPYPIGSADIEQLTGQQLDLAAFIQIPQLFFLGDRDANDASETCYFENGRELTANDFGLTPVARWPIAQKLYDSCGANSRFLLYENTGHEFTDAMREDILEFLLQYTK